MAAHPVARRRCTRLRSIKFCSRAGPRGTVRHRAHQDLLRSCCTTKRCLNICPTRAREHMCSSSQTTPVGCQHTTLILCAQIFVHILLSHITLVLNVSAKARGTVRWVPERCVNVYYMQAMSEVDFRSDPEEPGTPFALPFIRCLLSGASRPRSLFGPHGQVALSCPRVGGSCAASGRSTRGFATHTPWM